jgi:hypothetical protein
MHRTSIAQLLALALGSMPPGLAEAMHRAERAPRTWQPSNNRHRSHGGGHAGEAARRKARNRKRNKIARASRRANRA